MTKPDKSVSAKKTNLEESLEGTEAGKIWSEIKDKNIDMFALPNQKIHQYAQPRLIEPDKLYLLTTATSVLPALELSLGNNYYVEMSGRFVVVSRPIKSLIQ